MDKELKLDGFTKIDFYYPDSVASIKVAKAAKAEGELIVTGTKGYLYVPAPWWKTDYFELRFENSNDNKRFFYQLDGEGIRYEIVAFTKAIEKHVWNGYVTMEESRSITEAIEDYYQQENVIELLD